MTVPAFVTASAYTTTAGATTLAPALPASLVTNNLIISYVSIKATGVTFSLTGTDATNWHIIGQVNTGNQSCAAAWRLVDGSQAVVTWNWGGASVAGATQTLQFNGNLTVSPIGASGFAAANTSTSISLTGLTTTANNSLIYSNLLCSTSQTIPTPPDYPSLGTAANGNTSANNLAGIVGHSGATAPTETATITSANWCAFAIEIKGSGSPAVGARATGVVSEVLESYSDPTNLRVTGVVSEVLESYSNPTNLRVTGVVLEVLRSVASVTVTARRGRGLIYG